ATSSISTLSLHDALPIYIGEHELDALEFRDRFVELLALLGVGDAGIERALRQADGLRADGRAVEVERAHRRAKAPAFLADEIFRSEEHTSELQSRGHLVC